jgi:hypothetical protein
VQQHIEMRQPMQQQVNQNQTHTTRNSLIWEPNYRYFAPNP